MPVDPGGMLWLVPKSTYEQKDVQEPTQPEPGSILYCAGDPQGQWLQYMDPNAIRLSFLQIMADAAGMVADPDTDRTGYDVFVAPGETDRMTHAMREMSGCALVIRAALRLLGMVHRRLAPPYKVGAAFADLYEPALELGVLQSKPIPVDRWGIIAAFGRGKRSHVAAVARMESSKAWTIDGGQQDNKGNQCILWRERRFSAPDGKVRAFEERDLRWWIDPADLSPLLLAQWRRPFRFGSKRIEPPTACNHL